MGFVTVVCTVWLAVTFSFHWYFTNSIWTRVIVCGRKKQHNWAHRFRHNELINLSCSTFTILPKTLLITENWLKICDFVKSFSEGIADPVSQMSVGRYVKKNGVALIKSFQFLLQWESSKNINFPPSNETKRYVSNYNMYSTTLGKVLHS